MSATTTSRRSPWATPRRWLWKRRPAASTASTSPAWAAARSTSASPSLSPKWPRATSRPLMILSPTPTPCPASAAVSALRRASVRPGASGPSRRAGGHRPAGALCGRLVPGECQRHASEAPDQWHQGGGGGSGPASLTCASDLAKHGYEVTIFEPSTPPAACWCTASPSSACPRPSCRTRWTSSPPWAWIWRPICHRQDLRH